jgi:hypothetical protein
MNRLLSVFLLALAVHGLSPETLDPWRGWVTFKQYARDVNEAPDPGVSVQFTREGRQNASRLIFLRQVVHAEGDWLAPVGGVVCEFAFSWAPRRGSAWDEWSFEYPSFDRFVDVVEQHPTFQDLMVRHPVWSAVYWQGA